MAGFDPDSWIVIPNWADLQHYKDRNPAWIKLHTKLLSNPDYMQLPPGAKGLLSGLWLCYARTSNLLSIRDAHAMAGRYRDFRPHLISLNHAGFVDISASKPLAPKKEVEREIETPYPLQRKDEIQRALADRAAALAAGWNGGASDAFDEALDQLEQEHHAQLAAGDRYRLWDEALKRRRR